MKREETLNSMLENPKTDILVIGGGVLGAFVAREAATRGISVLLVEKSDFSSGASSNTSKIIHGDIYYAENLRFKSILNTVSTRKRMLKERSAKKIDFLFPLYENESYPFWRIEMNMLAYDAVAILNGGKTHRFLGRRKTLFLDTAIGQGALVGGVLYEGATVDDSRFVLETISEAENFGAKAINYLEVVGFEKSGKEKSVVLADKLSNKNYRVNAKCIISATGALTDSILSMMKSEHTPSIDIHKSVSIFVCDKSRELGLSLYDSRRKRSLFYTPWKKDVCVLTSATSRYEEDFNSTRANDADVRYLLGNMRRYLTKPINIKDVIITSAALKCGRENEVGNPTVKAYENENLITVYGGKIYSFKKMANTALNKAMKIIGAKTNFKIKIKPMKKRLSVTWPDVSKKVFLSQYFYGSNIEESVLRIIEEHPSEISDVGGDKRLPQALIRYFVENENARTLSDIMLRRLRFALTENESTISLGVAIAREMGALLNWDEKKMSDEVLAYKNEIEALRAPLFKQEYL